MDDFERYSDYNEIDESPKKSVAGLIIKIAIVAVCLLVLVAMIVRVMMFNYYPDGMKRLYFNDTLTAYYNAHGGRLDAKTQDLRAPYDDPNKGNFFADNLIVIEGAGQIQLSLRLNTSILDTIKKDYGADIELDKDSFTFELYRDPRIDGGEGTPVTPEKIGTLTYVEYDSFAMYRYYKLVFDGINFERDTDTSVEWLRVEIRINGVEMDKPYMIAIYENNEEYSKFTEYKPSKSERP